MPHPAAPRAAVAVREADLGDAADAAAVLEIVNAYASDPIGGGTPLAAEVRARLVPGLRANPATLVLLAVVGDRPVGVAVCFFGFSTFQAQPLLNVHDLAVLPDHRGRGIGRALLAGVEERARERDCCKLTLEVREDNRRARALYADVGFTDVANDSPVVTRFVGKPLPRT